MPSSYSGRQTRDGAGEQGAFLLAESLSKRSDPGDLEEALRTAESYSHIAPRNCSRAFASTLHAER